MGAMAYELDTFEVDGVDVAAILAWAETTASPRDREESSIVVDLAGG